MRLKGDIISGHLVAHALCFMAVKYTLLALTTNLCDTVSPEKLFLPLRGSDKCFVPATQKYTYLLSGIDSVNVFVTIGSKGEKDWKERCRYRLALRLWR